jgi:hypothetical protein
MDYAIDRFTDINYSCCVGFCSSWQDRRHLRQALMTREVLLNGSSVLSVGTKIAIKILWKIKRFICHSSVGWNPEKSL